jgi:hypothetical protein
MLEVAGSWKVIWYGSGASFFDLLPCSSKIDTVPKSNLSQHKSKVFFLKINITFSQICPNNIEKPNSAE